MARSSMAISKAMFLSLPLPGDPFVWPQQHVAYALK